MKKTLDFAEMDAQTVTALPTREMPQVLSGINVILLNGVTVFVPINVAANLCNISVIELEESGATTCTAESQQGGNR